MSLLVPWIGLPLVLGILSLGCAQALELASGIRVARALLLPVGFAVVIVVAQLFTALGSLAILATPVVVVLALVGLVTARRRLPRVAGPWLIGALVVYLAYGAPVLASGAATFAGYRVLDDTATWMALLDHVMSHGRDLPATVHSSYTASVTQYLSSGYPLGGFLGLGVTRQVMRVDLLWLYQPFLAYGGAMLALALYELVRRLVPRRAVAIAVAAIAAQPAILYGYSQWGGIKEAVAAALLPLLAALAGERGRAGGGWRAMLPLGVACSALLATLSVGAVVWIVPVVLPALVAGAAATRRAPWRALRLKQIGWLALIVAACSLPVIDLAKTFMRPLFQSGTGGGGVFTNEDEVGNLVGRLDLRQLLGIWPTQDFRAGAEHVGIVDIVLVAVVMLGVAGVVVAWRRGQRALPAYVIGAVVVAVAIHLHSSPWADGKSLAESSPALLLAALAMAAIGWERDALRRLGWVVGGLVAAAVLWSNALAYRGASLAPHDQLEEAVHISKLVAGRGPTLFNDRAVVASVHILRAADAAHPNNQVPLRDGKLLPYDSQTDVDQFDPDALWNFRDLVLRRGPDASRPPAAYELRWSGRYYELWQRTDVARQPAGHLALGDLGAAAAVPSCRDILYGAGKAGPGAQLTAVVRRAPAVIRLDRGSLPGGWQAFKPIPGAVIPNGGGTIERTFSVSTGGPWKVWLQGSSLAHTTISIDGRAVGSARHELDWVDRWIPFGTVRLPSGRHTLTLRYEAGGLAPGSGRQVLSPDHEDLGPVSLSQDTADVPTITVPAARARSLCGKLLDWVELPAT